MAEWSPHGVPEGSEVDSLPNEVHMFEFGDAVCLQGLKSEDTWNGAEGIVEAFDPESLRYRVRLGDGRVKEVYGDNLERRDGRFQRPTTAQSTISSQRPGTSQSVWTVSTRATTPSLGADRPRKRTTAEEAAAARPATALVMQSLQPPALSRPNIMRANRRMELARTASRNYQVEIEDDEEEVRPTSASKSLFHTAHNSFARGLGLREIRGPG